MIRSDQSTLVKKLNWKRLTSVWTSLSFVLYSPGRSVQLEHNVHEQPGNMPNLQIEHLSEHSQVFKTLQSLTVRMSEQIILLNELICKILDYGLWASVTPSTLWAPVTLVTVQTVSIQSADLGRLGLMLWSMRQTELDNCSDVSRSSWRDSIPHRQSISLRHTDSGELSPASMIRHRRSRSRSSSYDSVSWRHHSRSPSRSRGKKKLHKKRKLFSTSRSSSHRSFSSSSRE